MLVPSPLNNCAPARLPPLARRGLPSSAEKRGYARRSPPNQLVVGLDLDNGGVGFGSCGLNGFEPAYPFGISDGTVDAATDPFGAIPDTNHPSPELSGLPIDLTHDTAFSGRLG
jgi:hypothetical protein